MSCVDLRTLMSQITDVCRGAYGDFDWSQLGQVSRGRFEHPPGNLHGFVAIAAAEVESDQGGVTIRQWVRRVTVEIHAWHATDGPASLSTRTEMAEEMASELMTALENAKYDSAYANGLFNLREMAIASVGIDVDVDSAPMNFARCILSLEMTYSVDRGL